MINLNSVHNLKIELEIEERLLLNLERRKKRLLARMAPAGYPSGQSYIDADSIPGHGTMGFDSSLLVMDELDREIEESKKHIECIERDIQEIEYLVESLTGLEQKVKYMQMVEGKSLKVIAEELGYSYNWIRHIACNFSK